jgi:Salmonella virulence plasmid 65kDa B protein
MLAKRALDLFAAAILLTFLGLSASAQMSVTVAGSTPGQFSIPPSGAATYSIPIQVTPGVAGMQPKLELVYNSQNGNGPLGASWRLSGSSTISRCIRTMAQDGERGGVNFDMKDRYCLDGQRLMVISGAYGAAGSQHRTEIDGFSRIVANGTAGNGPASFTVQTKSGLTMQFGATADSRIEAQGKTSVSVWAFNQVADVKNNLMNVSYYEDGPNPAFYPKRIDYGGNSMQFEYEARPDVTPHYQAGSLTRMALRLKRLVSYTAATVMREYQLGYASSPTTQRSQLVRLTECGPDGNCLAATKAIPSYGTAPAPSYVMLAIS